ncbi:MAG: GFA family protein, partial [Paracoccaceae bacterium]
MRKFTIKEHEGNCLCGAVHFVASGDPVVVAQCHCVECKKTSGTGHTTGAMYSLDSVQITGAISKYSYVA